MDETRLLPTPEISRTQRRSLPGRRIGVAVAAIAALVLGAAAWAAWGYFDSINQLSRGTSPGVVEFTTNPGRVVVYYEGRTDPSLAELSISVTGPDGRSIRLQQFGYDLRYDIDRLVGHGVAVFDAPAAGTYVVTSRIPEGAGRIAVGADLGAATVFMVLAVIGALFVGALGVLLVVLFALTRSDRGERSRLAAPSGVYGAH